MLVMLEWHFLLPYLVKEVVQSQIEFQNLKLNSFSGWIDTAVMSTNIWYKIYPDELALNFH